MEDSILSSEQELVSLSPEGVETAPGPWVGTLHDQYAELSMAIISAPANFCTPLTLHSKFTTPFTVRVTLRHLCRLQLDFSLRVFSLSEQDAGDLANWDPSLHRRTDELDGNYISRRIDSEGEQYSILSRELEGEPVAPLSAARAANLDLGLETDLSDLHDLITEQLALDLPDALSTSVAPLQSLEGQLRTTVEDFTFDTLSFTKSTFMQKRYVAFTWMAKGAGHCVCLYKLPTIILSRRAEQTGRAEQILCGAVPQEEARPRAKKRSSHEVTSQKPPAREPKPAAPPAPPLSEPTGEEAQVSATQFREMVTQMYASYPELKRALTEEDYAGLSCRAGFRYMGCTKPGSKKENKISGMQYNSMRRWFSDALRLLSQVSDLWNKTDPPVVSSFNVGATGPDNEPAARPDGSPDPLVSESIASLLHDQPIGTFIISIGEQPGTLLISSVAGSQQPGVASTGWLDGHSSPRGSLGEYSPRLVVSMVSSPLREQQSPHSGGISPRLRWTPSQVPPGPELGPMRDVGLGLGEGSEADPLSFLNMDMAGEYRDLAGMRDDDIASVLLAEPLPPLSGGGGGPASESRPGTAASLAPQESTWIEEAVVDGADLASQRLDTWVRAMVEAQYLLDSKRKLLHPKQDVLVSRYRRLRTLM